MGRKAQVTVFIILGIVLMGIFGAVLFITNSSTKGDFETQAAPVSESVPQEFTALQQFVESCIYSIGKKGITVLASQGGYISPETLGDFSLTDQTNSAGINLDPLKVPYWHYNQNNNLNPAVSITSLQPELYVEDDDYYSIEAQLARYLNENIDSCLNDFEVFEEQGFVVTSEYPESKVSIRSNEVDFFLEMPLEVQKEDSNTKMENFVKSVDTDILTLYAFADEITKAQQENKFLENQVLDLILIHSGEDSEKLAPFNGVTLGSSVEWNADLMEIQLKEILSSYVPALKHAGASEFFQYEFTGGDESLTALSQRVSDNMILPLEGDQTYSVTFSYLNWDPFFSVNGGEENVDLIDYSFDSPFDFLKFNINYQQIYSVYDLSYPVLVTIEDPTAFEGEGITLNFALEANVRSNTAFDESYIQNPTVVAKAASLACNDGHRSTQEITTYLVDSFTFDPLDSVDVSFNLPGFDNCLIGNTDNIGKLSENYPSTYGGEIEFLHSDYLQTSLSIDTYFFDDEPGIVGLAVAGLPNRVIELKKKKEIEVEIMKKDIGKCIVPRVCNLDKEKCAEFASRICFFNSGSGLFLPEAPVYENIVPGSTTYLNEFYFTGTTKNLADTDSASIILERISDNGDGFIDEVFVAALSQEGPVSEGDSQIIELVPGIYKVSAQLGSKLEKEIGVDQRCDGSDKEKHCIDLDGQDLTSFVTLTSWEEEANYFEITNEDLYTAQKLTFFVLAANIESIPKKATSVDENGDEIEVNALLIEDLGLMSQSQEISQDPLVRSALEPVWS